MKALLTRYRGPALVGTALFACTLGWAHLERRGIRAFHSARLSDHADVLADALALLAHHVPLGRADGGAAFRQAVARHVAVRFPVRFLVVRQRGRVVVQLGEFPDPEETAAKAPSSGLLVVRRAIGGGSTTWGLPGDPDEPGHRQPPGLWGRWTGPDPATLPPPPPPPRPIDGEATLSLMAGIDRSLPPNAQRELSNTILMGWGFSWFGIACLLVAWVRSIRTRELTADLQKQREESARLEQMNLAAAGLAHETRNPLGLILGFAQRLAEDDQATPSARATGEQIVDEADRASARLSAFINFAASRPVQLRSIPAREVIEAVALPLRPDFEDAGMQLSLRPGSSTLRCDVSALEQILVNLLLNSLKASEAGSTTQVVVESDGRSARLLVRDEGRGVPEEMRDKIFQPYATSDASGHGLGLAIVKKLVDQLDWSIDVESRRGVGTTFAISGIEVVPAQDGVS